MTVNEQRMQAEIQQLEARAHPRLRTADSQPGAAEPGGADAQELQKRLEESNREVGAACALSSKRASSMLPLNMLRSQIDRLSTENSAFRVELSAFDAK